MENENQDESQVLETETEEAEASQEDSEASDEQAEETLTSEQIKALREKAAKAEELEKTNKQLFERAKKAEANKPKPADGLTPSDVLVLAKADVHQDDVSDLLEWAKFKKISVADALKSPTMKTMLADNAEKRKTDEATNTNGGPRGGSKVSGDDLLRKAERTGEVPTTAEGMAALAKARQDRLRAKKN